MQAAARPNNVPKSRCILNKCGSKMLQRAASGNTAWHGAHCKRSRQAQAGDASRTQRQHPWLGHTRRPAVQYELNVIAIDFHITTRRTVAPMTSDAAAAKRLLHSPTRSQQGAFERF